MEEEKAKKTQIENQKNLAEKKKQFAALKKSAAEDEKRQNKIDQAIAVFGIPILLWFMGSTTFIIPYGTSTGFLYISCLWIIAISLEVSLLMRAFGIKVHFVEYPNSLGNLYSAQLLAAARADLEGEESLESMWQRGEFEPLLQWMRDRVHARGSIISPAELIEEATGQPPTPQPFIDYLSAKIGRLYGVGA